MSWSCQPPNLKLDGVPFVERETSVSINEFYWKLRTLYGTLTGLEKKLFLVGGCLWPAQIYIHFEGIAKSCKAMGSSSLDNQDTLSWGKYLLIVHLKNWSEGNRRSWYTFLSGVLVGDFYKSKWPSSWCLSKHCFMIPSVRKALFIYKAETKTMSWKLHFI